MRKLFGLFGLGAMPGIEVCLGKIDHEVGMWSLDGVVG